MTEQNKQQTGLRCPRCGDQAIAEERYYPKRPDLNHLLVKCLSPKCRYQHSGPLH